ncbi:MAG: carbohydrate kinase family protein [Bacilli bacterium]|nr:carbohydrate kinase family protein [Bacilli bacterium]
MKFICMGSSVYDMTFVVDGEFREDGKKRAKDYVECGGGNGANYAYTLASWENDVDLISIVGNDLFGEALLKEYSEIGINKDLIEVRDNFTTPKSVIISNRNNSTRTIVTTSREVIRKLDVQIKDNGNIILLDGNYIDTAKELLDKNRNATIIFDIERNDPEIIELAKRANYIICSKDFAEEFTGIDLSNINDNLVSCYDKLSECFSNSQLIITLGKDGAFTKTTSYKLIKSIKVNAIDTTGSGDVFHAAFAHFLSKGYDLESILKYSSIAAALSTTKVGCRNKVPKLEEVLNYNDII